MNLDTLVAQAREPKPQEPGLYGMKSPGGEWEWRQLAWHPVRSYSSDPAAAAMLQAEVIKAGGWYNTSYLGTEHGVLITMWKPWRDYWGKGESAEAAWCRAWLAWKGISLEGSDGREAD